MRLALVPAIAVLVAALGIVSASMPAFAESLSELHVARQLSAALDNTTAPDPDGLLVPHARGTIVVVPVYNA